MVCGFRPLAAVLGLGLAACSSIAPTSQSGVERQSIIGGELDSTDRAVFGILIKNQALCSGTLIAPNLVLTARHCVADLSTGEDPIDCTTTTFGPKYAASSFILSWAADLTANVPSSAVYRASDVRVPDPTIFCGNDVALLILSSNVASSSVTPIAPRVNQMPTDYESFTAVGYGLTDPNDTQGTTAGVRHDLGGLSVECVGAIDCLGTRAKDDEWAASASICHGDSGGPALDAQGRVIGVASRADTACSFGLYSTVSAWQSLIVSTAIDAATAGGYDPPAWTGSTTPGGGMAGSAATGASGGGGTGGNVAAGGSAGAAAGRAANGGGSGASMGGTSARGGATGNAGRGGSDSGSGGSAGDATPPVVDSGLPPPLPDAAAPDDDGGLVKTGPELGETCTEGCFGDLVCYSANGKPPGTCLAPCDGSAKTDTSCPENTVCSANFNACIPKPSSDSGGGTKTTVSCGCRVGDSAHESGWSALAALAFCGGMLRRKRRAQH
jgi:MYXO-CTERM domain-containing protein